MEEDVPLVVSEVNPEELDRAARGIVANPNCTTMAIMLPLKALHDAFGLTAIVATSYQAAGGAGQRGMDELAEQVPGMFAERERLVDDGAAVLEGVKHAIHAAPLAFNVVPLLGTVGEGGYTDEELKLRDESRKILALPDLAGLADLRPGAVMVGHAVQVRATFEREPCRRGGAAVLEAFPGVVLDDVRPPSVTRARTSGVGRVRADLSDPKSLNSSSSGQPAQGRRAATRCRSPSCSSSRGLPARAAPRLSGALRARAPGHVRRVLGRMSSRRTSWSAAPRSRLAPGVSSSMRLPAGRGR
jgi:aspartate-semialdehyde dehydrogenase